MSFIKEYEPTVLEQHPPIPDDPIGYLAVSTVELNLSRTLGKILTILDATIADSRQNKACKDLIRAELNGVMNYFYKFSQPNECNQSPTKLQPVFD